MLIQSSFCEVLKFRMFLDCALSSRLYKDGADMSWRKFNVLIQIHEKVILDRNMKVL
jgi:hypothetical protein